MYLQYDPLQDQGYQRAAAVAERSGYERRDHCVQLHPRGDRAEQASVRAAEAAREEMPGYAPEKFAGDGIEPIPGEIREVIRDNWGERAFFFIGAAGIAVRYIAPFVRDKFTDSAVLVLDEKGRYVIPLLSGHMGGAVRMADEAAELIRAEAVHTTATDVQKKFAVDVFAKRNHLLITDRQTAKEISAAVLEGERIALFPEYPGCRIEGNAPDELVLCGSREEASAFRYRIVVGDGLSVLEPVRSF